MPFGQERGKKDQIHLFEGSIMRMAPEIKAHRLKKLRARVGVMKPKRVGAKIPLRRF
jgi:hypothetical protein